MDSIKCIHCIEEYLQLPEDDEERRSGEAWSKVREADTLVPLWQQLQLQPGQVMFGLVTVPVCVQHMKIEKKKETASPSGLLLPTPLIPGMN